MLKIRRQRELRRNILLTIIITALVITAMSLFFTLKSVASDGSDVEYYKYFKTIQVSQGETIEDLAEIYANPEMTSEKLYAEEVRFINNLDSSENPISGKYIIIPYYDTIHS